MKILKFGGTSVGDPERIRGVVGIVERALAEGELAVVVSAFSGVTDALLGAAHSAQGGGDWQAACAALESRHREAAAALASDPERPAVEAVVAGHFAELRDLLHGVALLREASPRVLDAVASYGERLSAGLVAAALRRAGAGAEACDARALIVTDAEFGAARVDLERSRGRVRDHFGVRRPLQVVTGFVAATPEGETTTLGRGGSDYTASLLGAALEAEAVEIWTDVDGVMSADPRLVPDAEPLESMSYDELMELSHFGAKVIYPPSVHPTRAAGVPLVIRNTLRPEAPGTRVTPAASAGRMVCGVTSIDPVALLRLEGDGMVGVPGIAMRLFGALARRDISVILISQASSEHSVCFAIDPAGVEAATAEVEREFALERHAGLVDPLVVERDQAVVAAVGSGMRERPGIAGRLFGLLGERGVNVRAIAQGSSERNISLVVARGQRADAVRAIHTAFFAGPAPIELVVAGVGRVGRALLEQLSAAGPGIQERRGLRPVLLGVASSRRMRFDAAGIAPGEALAALEADGEPCEPERLAELLATRPGPRRVLVDASASDAVPRLYDRVLESGGAVVTANKRRLAGPLEAYRPLLQPGRRMYYETTVGAGLPVLGTLRDLRDTGDTVLCVEGLLSGTLGFLMDASSSGRRFSEALREAWERGYTEPHPAEDLSGADVARKIVILAREIGLELELDDVVLEPLLAPEPWSSLPVAELWSRLGPVDAELAERQARAARGGRRLCYLARIEHGRAEVGLRELAPEHPCATARGAENVVAFTTSRYSELPLTVRGPGAGPHVTAAGLLADVLRAALEVSDRWRKP